MGEVGSIQRYDDISVYEVGFKFDFNAEFFQLDFYKTFLYNIYKDKAHTANSF